MILLHKTVYTWLGFFAIAVYLAFIGYCIREEKFFYLAFPLMVTAGIFAFLKMDKTLLLIYFLAPLSVPLRTFFPQFDLDFYITTEPFLAFLTILFIIKTGIFRQIDKRIFLHPVSIAVFFSLFWILVTSITSTMPLVSVKFLVSRVWFVVPFYFMAVMLFQKIQNIRTFIYLYLVGLIIVIVYTFNNHMAYGLNDQQAANWMCYPFYNDHTSYGAAIVMMIFGLMATYQLRSAKKTEMLFMAAGMAILLIALVYSYTRAAWVSLAGVAAIWLLIRMKIPFKWIAFGVTVSIISFILVFNSVMDQLERNQQDASGNFSEHLTSITNISTDASNVERLNRWNSTLRMFSEKPVFGWGPGTYMFQYAPFQYEREKTIISTNFGDGGNAHSEYLGPLAESGVFGSLYFLVIGVLSFITGMRVYKRAASYKIRNFALTITLGLSTYLLHAFLNNFLDTDKISALFWGFIAILVSMDIYALKTDPKTPLANE